jgi:autotransporter strand-loop-strand O-heptosyltransferase
MKIKIDYATHLPLKIGTPVLDILVDNEEEKGLPLLVEYINKTTNQVIETKNITISNISIPGPRQYYTDWNVNVYYNDNLIFTYDLDLSHKTVFIKIDSIALGDTLAWIDYVDQFRIKHNCNVICSTFWNQLFINSYPNIMFVVPNTRIDNIYAQYYVGAMGLKGYTSMYCPIHELNNPLQKIATETLGLDFIESKPKLFYKIKPRKKKVCLSEFASSKVKEWNIPGGWQAVVDLFVKNGYEVVVISKEPTQLVNITNKTGDHSIEDRIEDLIESEYFIGISSGLTWLAWGCNTHVFLISDLTPPYHEFTTNCTRIYNEDDIKESINYKKEINPVSIDHVLSKIGHKLGVKSLA